MVATLKHYMNPLHIYCRLRDVGIPKNPAMLVCRVYERTVFRCIPVQGNVNKTIDETWDVQKSINQSGLNRIKTS
jgi:hypothetical protein